MAVFVDELGSRSFDRKITESSVRSRPLLPFTCDPIVNKHLLPLGLMLSVLVACSRSPSPEQQTKALKTIGSWTATARLLGEAWQQERVPQHYTEQTLEKAQAEMKKELKDVPHTACGSETDSTNDRADGREGRSIAVGSICDRPPATNYSTTSAR